MLMNNLEIKHDFKLEIEEEISPSNILRIHALFQSYFQRFERSRQHCSSISPGINGFTILMSYQFRASSEYMG